MAYNQNEITTSLKQCNGFHKRSRQLLPKISKGFPKDFFYEDAKKDSDQDYDFEISMKFTSNKPAIGEIENFLQHFQHYFSNKDLLSAGSRFIEDEDSVVISSSRLTERNSSQGLVSQTKLRDIVSKRGSQGKDMSQHYNIGALSQMTFGDIKEAPNSVEIRTKKSLDLINRNPKCDDDKENIPPILSNRGGRIFSEPAEPKTPVFKPSSFRRAQMLRELKAKETDVSLGMTQNFSFRAPLSQRDMNLNIAGRKGLNLAKVEIIRHSKSNESRRLNETNHLRSGFLPSLIKENKF